MPYVRSVCRQTMQMLKALTLDDLRESGPQVAERLGQYAHVLTLAAPHIGGTNKHLSRVRRQLPSGHEAPRPTTEQAVQKLQNTTIPHLNDLKEFVQNTEEWTEQDFKQMFLWNTPDQLKNICYHLDLFRIKLTRYSLPGINNSVTWWDLVLGAGDMLKQAMEHFVEGWHTLPHLRWMNGEGVDRRLPLVEEHHKHLLDIIQTNPVDPTLQRAARAVSGALHGLIECLSDLWSPQSEIAEHANRVLESVTALDQVGPVLGSANPSERRPLQSKRARV